MNGERKTKIKKKPLKIFSNVATLGLNIMSDLLRHLAASISIDVWQNLQIDRRVTRERQEIHKTHQNILAGSRVKPSTVDINADHGHLKRLNYDFA
jgi:hypothetical protein